MSKPKKKFSETKVGKFLKTAAPGIIGTVGDVLPDAGVLGLVKNLIQKEPDAVLPPEDKEKALKLLEMDMIEMQEVSKRWDSDMKSDSWLSKNVRPLVLVWCIVIFSFAGILDSVETIPFNIHETWNDTFEKVMMAVILAYFGGRTTEKASNIFKNNKK